MTGDGQEQLGCVAYTIELKTQLAVSTKPGSRCNFKNNCLNLTYHKSLKYYFYKG